MMDSEMLHRERELMLYDVVMEYPNGLLVNSKNRDESKNGWEPTLGENPYLTDRLVKDLNIKWQEDMLLNNINLTPQFRAEIVRKLSLEELKEMFEGNVTYPLIIQEPIMKEIIAKLDQESDSEEELEMDYPTTVMRALVTNATIDSYSAHYLYNSRYDEWIDWDRCDFADFETVLWIINNFTVIDNYLYNRLLRGHYSLTNDQLSQATEAIMRGDLRRLVSEGLIYLVIYTDNPLNNLKTIVEEFRHRISEVDINMILTECNSVDVVRYIMEKFIDKDIYNQATWRSTPLDDELAIQILRDREWEDARFEIMNNPYVSIQVKLDFLHGRIDGSITRHHVTRHYRINPYVNDATITYEILRMISPLALTRVSSRSMIQLAHSEEFNLLEYLANNGRELVVRDVNSLTDLLKYDIEGVDIKFEGEVTVELLQLASDERLRYSNLWYYITLQADYNLIVKNPDYPWNEALLTTRAYTPTMRRFITMKSARNIHSNC